MEVLKALIAVQSIVQTHSSIIALSVSVLFVLFAIMFFWRMLFLFCKVAGLMVFAIILFQGTRSTIALLHKEVPSLQSKQAITALSTGLSQKLKDFDIRFKIRHEGEKPDS